MKVSGPSRMAIEVPGTCHSARRVLTRSSNSGVKGDVPRCMLVVCIVFCGREVGYQ